MANKIEILENTIIKLLFRRGTDTERQSVVFALGEPGFTTDTNRLVVGDGVTAGGIPIGVKFHGMVNAPPATSSAVIGDLYYNTQTSKMYFLSASDAWGPL
jgi:hypothetical protein